MSKVAVVTPRIDSRPGLPAVALGQYERPFISMICPDYITPGEVAAMLKHVVTVKTLSNWRSDRRKPGPPFTRVGNRILYERGDVVRWAAKRRFEATDRYKQSGGEQKASRQPAFQADTLATLKQELDAKLADIQSKRDELDGLEGELLWLFERRIKALKRGK